MRAERIPLGELIGPEESGDAMERLAERVAEGAVFVYPTETIYGLGGVVDSEVERRILAAKRRPSGLPMIVVGGSVDALSSLRLVFGDCARALADAFWPGKLTLVVPSAALGRGVAVRVSAHPFLRALSVRLCRALYSTSANVSGEAYVNDPDRIYDLFSEHADFMVDGGRLPDSQPSTVVKVGGDGTVEVVREGAIPAERVTEIVGRRVNS
jgi:L-threonylcarbamoyladenylate synthase